LRKKERRTCKRPTPTLDLAMRRRRTDLHVVSGSKKEERNDYRERGAREKKAREERFLFTSQSVGTEVIGNLYRETYQRKKSRGWGGRYNGRLGV